MSESQPILSKVRQHLRALSGYVPIEPPEVLAERLGIAAEEIVKLDGNENPYGPSPRALKALADCRTYHIYPDPEQRRLRQALSRYLDMPAESIIAGAGSDELIDLAVRLFVPPGGGVLNFPPTFGMYAFSTEIADGRILNVERRADFSLDLDTIRKAAPDANLIFVASPNNPTGNSLGRDEIDVLLGTGLPVVIDEAYAEFAGQSCIGLIREHPNLIVLRTLSKWGGIAGLRVGYMVASRELIDVAMKIKQPYSISVAADVAAVASLEDADNLRHNLKTIIKERERLAGLLSGIDYLDVLPSEANFLLCRVQGKEARAIRDRLAKQGIMIRYFDTPILQNYIRITVGRPDQTDKVIAALQDIARVG